MIPQLFDLKLYNDGKDWKKLAVGAYGTVYECQTGLENPKSVAIKQMDLPSDIYDRCVLHDIFTEITCPYYRELFWVCYDARSDHLISEIWRPKWTTVTDPSARLLIEKNPM